MRSEIVALGGEATVFAADAISEGGTEDIEALFRRSREQEYRQLKGEIDRLLPRTRRRSTSAATHVSRRRALRTLRERFKAIERVDFFTAAGAAETAAALAALERSVVGRKPSAPEDALRCGSAPSAGSGSRGPVRVSTAWPRPGSSGGTSTRTRRLPSRINRARATSPFDMYSGEFSHHGENCTFEVLSDRFGLDQPAISRIGRHRARPRHEGREVRPSGGGGDRPDRGWLAGVTGRRRAAPRAGDRRCSMRSRARSNLTKDRSVRSGRRPAQAQAIRRSNRGNHHALSIRHHRCYAVRPRHRSAPLPASGSGQCRRRIRRCCTFLASRAISRTTCSRSTFLATTSR